MTEEQANELAARLTVALIASKQAELLFVKANPQPQDVAKPIAELFLSIRDTLQAQKS